MATVRTADTPAGRRMQESAIVAALLALAAAMLWWYAWQRTRERMPATSFGSPLHGLVLSGIQVEAGPIEVGPPRAVVPLPAGPVVGTAGGGAAAPDPLARPLRAQMQAWFQHCGIPVAAPTPAPGGGYLPQAGSNLGWLYLRLTHSANGGREYYTLQLSLEKTAYLETGARIPLRTSVWSMSTARIVDTAAANYAVRTDAARMLDAFTDAYRAAESGRGGLPMP